MGDTLYQLEHKEHSLYDQRTAIGRIADQKSKFAKEMPVYANVPAEPVSASELIRQQQDILARNGENQRKRDQKNTTKSSWRLLSPPMSVQKQAMKRQ